MTPEQNDLITRVGPGTRCGTLMRHYWHPVALTDELLDERGREFAYEMHRREDLIRFGKFGDAWWAKDQDPDKHYEFFPIPFTILTANPSLKQNPGY